MNNRNNDFNTPTKRRGIFVSIAHLVVSMLIITPAKLMFWRSIWGFLDMYIFASAIPTTIQIKMTNSTSFKSLSLVLLTYPSNNEISFNNQSNIKNEVENPTDINQINKIGIIVFIAAITLRFLTEVVQQQIYKFLNASLNKRPFTALKSLFVYFFSYLYVIINTIITVVIWRGEWYLLTTTTSSFEEHVWKIQGAVLIVSLALVICCKATLSLVECPLMTISSDNLIEIFNSPTVLGFNSTKSPKHLFILDIFTSTLVYCILVSVWWSMWFLVDETEFSIIGTEFNEYSDVSYFALKNLVIGYSICTTAYILSYMKIFSQRPQNLLWKQYLNRCYTILRFLLIIFGTTGCIFLWKGLWCSLDIWSAHFIPNTVQNFLLTGICSVILLILFGCLNTSSSRGVNVEKLFFMEEQERIFEIKIPYLLCVSNQHKIMTGEDICYKHNENINIAQHYLEIL